MTQEDIRQTEAYLNNELNFEARASFQQRLDIDASFASEVEAHKIFRKILQNYGARKKLKYTLDNIHSTLTKEAMEQRANVFHSTSNFFKKYYPTMAVAASIAAITAAACLFIFDYFHSAGNGTYAHYRELKRDVDRIKRTQKAIISSLDENEVQSVLPNYGATAFSISRNGYMITSYHVVKDADSIWVGNEKHGDLKAEVIHVDPVHDLALIKVKNKRFKLSGQLPFYIKPGKIELGEHVYTLGYPKEDLVYGEGSIGSATGYDSDPGAFQVSVPVNPGNSGSPLLDEKGNIIGMISGKHIKEEGASFAIKSVHLLYFLQSAPKNVLKDLKLNRKNSIYSYSRTKQIKKIRDFVFVVKVYRD